MDMGRLHSAACDFVRHTALNRVRAEDAMREDLVGLPLFEQPLLAVGAACDPLFAALRQENVVHSDTWLPQQWNSHAVSVVSFFLPFTEDVRKPNRQANAVPSDTWLHGRMEGQDLVEALGRHLCVLLEGAGHSAVFPTTDSRFGMVAPRRSNWSERHVAYICGLGTFGMCKGIITAKGMAGRLGSLLTSCPLPTTPRPYTDIYEYCSRCGLCAQRCPAGAIDAARSMHEAKAHAPCASFLDEVRAWPPRGASARVRYGCGKCQVGVPCEARIPRRRGKS